ncbi:cell cycle switch protein CCS52a [Thecamonas trahens ATCC 50062]|uniref:Cell cycle switch protein CCS52a n=1 Tax=Thecamonas trahens ATCC 50062 TaxID=461836 RepID=A0A0L0DAU1_THETB|nr:cell cycle switch protein CCS52a [Thecamonas trahens ATCC 50062]KNC49474.1 cell cycle switch protein CCS52a [Thecamonas trahens ATCC 50062]|eukprot:XP_013757893.1 cell cycle switch protein CCS52a [Thecamonas trahens ATCC 50062]
MALAAGWGWGCVKSSMLHQSYEKRLRRSMSPKRRRRSAGGGGGRTGSPSERLLRNTKRRLLGGAGGLDDSLASTSSAGGASPNASLDSTASATAAALLETSFARSERFGSAALENRAPSPVYADRYIPSRAGTNYSLGLSLLDAMDDENEAGSAPGDGAGPSGDAAPGAGAAAVPGNMQGGRGRASSTASDASVTGDAGATTYSTVLRSELLAFAYSSPGEGGEGHAMRGAGGSPHRAAVAMASPSLVTSPRKSPGAMRSRRGRDAGAGVAGAASSPARRNLFQYAPPAETQAPVDSPYSLTPVGIQTQRLLLSPRKAPRKISRVPFKVLDAPRLKDDFYYNLIDWSALNMLAVGLGSCVYLWSACTSKVFKLCDVGPNDTVASVTWVPDGKHLAVGTVQGKVEVWDAAKRSLVRTFAGHRDRVGTMAWSTTVLATGSRDRQILQHDLRAADSHVGRFYGHNQEVCGLRWSPDEQHLASGGNDNRLLVWSVSSTLPVLKITAHKAAIKAIAWSPHQSDLLATGGGTADRCIKFWNIAGGTTPLSIVDTGSQVCNLHWSRNVNELVSTHGYSQNQIVVWSYPSMRPLSTLTGHTYRVLYLAVSPDGQTVATGAGDETLRFWNVFPSGASSSSSGSPALHPSRSDIR